MVHSDDKGLVLPPKIANIQAVIIPILKKGQDNQKALEMAKDAESLLKKAGYRVHVDDRENYNPGFKYNHWELRGVPIRLEIGAKEVENAEVRYCKRNDGAKASIKMDVLVDSV